MTRNESAPSSSSRSASSSNCSATAWFLGRVAATASDDRRVTAVVCLPTYNERDNVERMVRALGEHDVRVLVIDDNSPDGTGEIADRLAGQLDYVDVLHRQRKQGLGPAYPAGFRRALAGAAEP